MGGPAAGEDQFGVVTEAVLVSGVSVDAVRPNKDGANFTVVEVANVGDQEQGPDVAVPDGFDLLIALRIDQAPDPVGYVAGSAADLADATKRKHLRKGIPLTLGVTNMNQLYFGSDTDATIFELTAEKN
jgi:hypothetical protein